MKLPRRRQVPAAVRSVALLPGERRLAWGLTADGAPLVATPTRLLLPGTESLDWIMVEKAAWRPPLLTVTEVAEVEGTGRERSFTIEQDAALAEVVRARVTSSVAWSDRRRLDPRGAVRLVGRRVPGEEALLWQLVFDRETDPSDPLVRAQATGFLDAVRRTIG